MEEIKRTEQIDNFVRFLNKKYLIDEQDINEDVADYFIKNINPYAYMYLNKNDVICIDTEVILLLKRISDIMNMFHIN